MDKTNWNELRDRAYQNAVKHGWYKKKNTGVHDVMMIITELSEAINADRKINRANRMLFENDIHTPHPDPEKNFMLCYGIHMKDSVEDELADAFIRSLSLCGAKGKDMDPDYFTDESVNIMLGFMLQEEGFVEQIFSIVYTLITEEEIFIAMTRMLALAVILDIDLLWYVEQKMKYNEMRPYKHGKLY